MAEPELNTETWRCLDILGVRVHVVTLSEALDLVAEWVAQGQPRQLATVNPEFVMAAQDNASFRAVLNSAALCVPDGIGLVWASRWLGGGVRLRQRVAGVELTEQIAARAARQGWRVFLLGAAPGVAEKTAATLQARYPGLIVAGTYAGSPSIEEEDAIAQMVRAAQADVLFVAYGAPAQDVWIARNLDRLGVSVAAGVGGSFDFISGVAARAPRWVQRLGLEWLHRLICQPWRWKRQLSIPRFIFRVLYSMLDVRRPTFNRIAPLALFVGVLALYVSTLAPGAAPGDPSEYVFVPRILGIAHPPGYVFYTLLAWLWQNLARVGTLAYRTNLLAAAAGASISVLVYGIISNFKFKISNSKFQTATANEQYISRITYHISRITFYVLRFTPALFGGMSAAVTVDLWQHSLHANAHIVSALLAALALFLLVRWWASGNDRWLYGLALVAGLSVTQHPLLVFGFPAYVVFILLQWFSTSKDVTAKENIVSAAKKLPAPLLFFALGLSAWLYIPLRGPAASFNRLSPTLDAFLRHVTAQGLRVNLFAFGLGDQPMRLNVFGQLLGLQYSPAALALAVLGGAWLIIKRPNLFALFALFFAAYVLFVINTIQDVMAYLMLPFIVVAVMAGTGVQALVSMLEKHRDAKRYHKILGTLVSLWLMTMPLYSAWRTAPRVSLREYRAGPDWVEAVFARFEGKGERAILLAPWEWMTPLWVAEAEGRKLDPADVTLVYVAATSDNPYLDNVFKYWGQGPVYLADFRRGVWEGGLFRLRPVIIQPSTFLWQVVAPGDTSIPSLPNSLNVMAEGQAELVAYDLDARTLHPGQTARLTLAMRAPVTPTHYLMPFALVGDRAYRWTTDSRALSITWRPGEVIVERYDITIPFGAPPGRYPLRLGLADLSAGRDLEIEPGITTMAIGEITIESALGVGPPPEALNGALANFDSRVALMGARACAASTCSAAFWPQAVSAQPGQSIEVWLDWRALQPTDDSYKVFVHLITPDNRLVSQGDYYTPLGGAFPSALWIPRWIEGQTFSDPYRLPVPNDLPPGDYVIEVGLYGLTSLCRAPLFDAAGNLAGDRVILGAVRVK